MLTRVPELGPYGKDPLTGGVAPYGKVTTLEALQINIGGGLSFESTNVHIQEMADLWKPGNRNQGITVDGDTGRILPQVVHVPIIIPTRSVLGGDYNLSQPQIEVIRRNQFATWITSSARLTPVHHIIGHSEQDWHGRMSPEFKDDRDEWLGMLWEPEHLRALMKTYEGIYKIPWNRLPTQHILAPIGRKVTKEERDGVKTAPLQRLKLRRARTELEIIKAVAGLVIRGEMDEAAEQHKRFEATKVAYEKEAGPLIVYQPDLLA